eukprot:6479978-Amphidinium_carterae.1
MSKKVQEIGTAVKLDQGFACNRCSRGAGDDEADFRSSMNWRAERKGPPKKKGGESWMVAAAVRHCTKKQTCLQVLVQKSVP